MNQLAQKICLNMTWFFVATVGGAFVVAGWIPPFSPNGSKEQIAAHFHHHQNVRIAAAMFFFGGASFVFPSAVYAAQLRRIEGPRSVYAQAQMLISAVGTLFIMIPASLWLAISYYNNISDDVIVVLNAVAWFMILGAVASAILQNVGLGFCILGSDGSVYPRWVGYVNLYCGMGLMVGILIPFFKHGPFAWNGLFGFWVVATDFFIWVFVMYFTTLQAINADVPTAEAVAEPALVAAR